MTGCWLAVSEVAGGRRRPPGRGRAGRARPGFAAAALADLAIVATEMATNLARHAVDGVVLIRMRRHGDAAGSSWSRSTAARAWPT